MSLFVNDFDIISELNLPSESESASDWVPDLKYLSSLTVTTVHTLLDHVRDPWHGYYWHEKNDACVDISIFQRKYLEHLWNQFFVTLDPGCKCY